MTAKMESLKEMGRMELEMVLDESWEQVAVLHKEYLAPHKVALPARDSYKAIWLSILHICDDGYIHKDDITEILRKIKPEAGRDQQVRHLIRDGWNLLTKEGKGGEHFMDWYKTSPSFAIEQVRRQGRLQAETFDELKIAYGSKCATCGATEGRPDTRYNNQNIALQQGHRDPEKPDNDRDNVIPQCQFCNRAYKDHFTFDEKGRVDAIASIEPVKRASAKVRKEVRDWANESQ